MSTTAYHRSHLRRISNAYVFLRQHTWLVRAFKNSRDYTLIFIGVLAAGMGLKGFVLPNKFTDGGVTGVSILTSFITHWPLPVFLILFNLPFLVLGYRQISKQFAIKSVVGIAALAMATAFIPYPVMTDDKLLAAVFGGFFLGAGIGLAMRGGGVIDGTEVLALNVSRRSVFSVGDVILSINIVIFTFAIFVLGFEHSMYSVLTYLAAAKTVDFIVQGIEEYTGFTVISSKSNAIREAIVHDLGRGVTIYKGERGYGRNPVSANSQDNQLDIIFCVVTRLEIGKLRGIVEKMDPQAFMIIQSINEIHGGMVKRRPLH
ncbi:MAG TPA: YitT family protein [Chitinophagales bacterium]|nr:YitT family protein [Chitinophagales bacterium]